MILLLDNYDSFSYNLYQLMGSLNPEIQVIRNDEMTVDEMKGLHPQAMVISPARESRKMPGICMRPCKSWASTIPILGVCLGHQSICAAFGATVSYAKTLMHGKQSMTTVDTSCPLYPGLSRNHASGKVSFFGRRGEYAARLSDGDREGG
ncbi:MAG: glutamine amidotransferase-related protein [Clostridia bacterium]